MARLHTWSFGECGVTLFALALRSTNANFIKHNRHFMSTYFLLDPFEFPYYFYRIPGELIYVLSIVVRIPSTCIYIYIYIYIYIFWQHFFVNTIFIKHNRHFMSTYFLLDPFEFPYYFYHIRGELIYVLSIVVCIPSTNIVSYI